MHSGSGAFGFFEVTNDLTKYTNANFLNRLGKQTKLFMRFSTVGGEKGSSDTARDPRGFAIKLYTEEGNYDIVGNNTPVFFIRDAIKFPDFIHSQKLAPGTGLKDPDMMWDFFSLNPETMHQMTILFSNRGTPYGFRHMHGFGTDTFMWYTENNDYCWIKYHFITNQGIKNFSDREATEAGGKNPFFGRKDLHDAIVRGDFPSWKVYVQIMTREQAKTYKFDPFDATKVWYHKDFPLIPLGKIVLNKNPDNFFAQVEQSAFAPSNMVTGIGPSPDKLLQGRMMAYTDAHRYRLGVNAKNILVNKPITEIFNYQRDGLMNTTTNYEGRPNYYPNSFEEVLFDPTAKLPNFEVEAGIASRHVYKEIDDYVQPGELYRRVLSEKEKTDLVTNVALSLVHAKKAIQYRMCANLYKIDKDYGTRVSYMLKLELEEVIRLSKLSNKERISETKLSKYK
ncbi:MAG: catalase [Clostridia bacterium]